MRCVVVVLGLKWFERESCSIGRSWLLKASAFDAPGEVGGERSLRRITSEQGTAFYALSGDRKQTTYAFVSWKVRRDPRTIQQKLR